MFFLTGDNSDCDYVAYNFPSVAHDESSAYGLMVYNGVVYWVVNDGGVMSSSRLTHDMTAGSGEAYAQAAMDFGCNAKQAIKYAMTRDCKTGGKVRVFKVK